MKKLKKIFKILALVFILILGTIIALPFIFEDKIINIVKDQVNNNVNAKFDFTDADLSLLKSFPNATVVINEISLVNFEPFENDTLFSANEILLKMSIKELFKKPDEIINVKKLYVRDANINILLNEEGKANYDIGKENESDESASDDDGESGFNFTIAEYEITNSNIKYIDEKSGFKLKLLDFVHFGKGDFSKDQFNLDTKTDTNVSMIVGDKDYLKNTHINLDAILGMDFVESKFTFLENKAIINRLPLIFDGFIKVNDNNQEMKLGLKTESSEFKNFLALIPEEYSKNIDDVNTTGEFTVQGVVLGILDDKHVPTFDIKINSDNASFKYPDLPKRVNNINVLTNVVNKTGLIKDTYIDINKLSLKIDEDTFSAKAKLSNVTENMLVNGEVLGTLNLANLSKAYPFTLENELKGILTADVKTMFDMNSVKNKAYENTKNEGKISLKDFEFTSEEMTHPVKINRANIDFSHEVVTLNKFDAQTGNTDFIAMGTINNLLGFMFNGENIEGKFDLTSDTFSVNDFMTVEETKKENGEVVVSDEKIKIPSFLDCTVNAEAKTVLYDNLTLKNVTGTLFIKDETATLKDLKTDVFDGKLAVNGKVSTKEEVPVFDMSLGIDGFNIGESFSNLDLFKALSPIANAIKGKLNSTISISGNLNNDLTPNLSSISGKGDALVSAKSISPDKVKVLGALNQNMNFINFEELDLKELKTSLSFDDGRVSVKPFQLKYKDISIDISGNHGFDKSLDYVTTFNVPAKYLGSEVTSLMAKLGEEDTKNMTVPVTAAIGGNYASPKVSSNLNTAVSGLTKQLIAKQKQKLIGKGTEEVKNVLGDLLGGNKTKESGSDPETVKKDSIKNKNQEELIKGASNLLNNVFGKKKDTVK